MRTLEFAEAKDGQTERTRKRTSLLSFWRCRTRRRPLAAKAPAGITVACAPSPMDLVPDCIPVPGCLDDVILLPLHAAFSDFSSLLNQAQNKSGASSGWMAFLAFNPSAWQISVNQSPISCAHLHNFRFHSTAQPDPYGKLHERLTAQAVRAQNRSSALLR